jgi:hypothetical protein
MQAGIYLALEIQADERDRQARLILEIDIRA